MTVKIGRQRIWSMVLGTTQRLSIHWEVAPLLLLDGACIAVSMALAYLLRFEVMEYQPDFSPAFYVRLVGIALLMWESIFAFFQLYDKDHLFGGFKEYSSVVTACSVGVVGLVLYGFLDRSFSHNISRMWLAMVWAFSVIGVGVTRFVYRRWIYHLRKQGFLARRALIVGANEEGEEIASQLRALPTSGFKMMGFVDPDLAVGTRVRDMPVLGDLSALKKLVEQSGVEELIVIPTALSRDQLLEIYRDWGKDRRVRISLSSGLYELFTTSVQVREVGFVPLLSVNQTRITGIDAAVKAVLDYVLTLMGGMFLSPFLLLIAVLVRLDSKGPIIYRRRVVGLHGRAFDAFKFRTMMHNAEEYLEQHPELMEEWEQSGKIENDPRITRVGHVLRRYSLDELPQLLNVLKGEMSLVGPRMLTSGELRHFGRWRYNLLTVKPGLTGLWQVSGRADLAYEDRVRLDMQYIRNHTFWLDLKLLMNTISAVLTGKGAY